MRGLRDFKVPNFKFPKFKMKDISEIEEIDMKSLFHFIDNIDFDILV